MNFTPPPPEELKNESDVEQKLLYPLLISEPPYGLGLGNFTILTKTNVRRFSIGKGSDQKLYFPDYVIVTGGLPLLVIEAKSPGEGVQDAFREARLYATELNAVYAPGLNPLTKIVACDGLELVAGTWDHAEPPLKMNLADLNPVSSKMASLLSMVGKPSLTAEFQRLSALLKPEKHWKPRRLLGGTSVQDEEIGQNTFGASIAAEFAHVFNPANVEDRIRIATEAYISSKRRERYVEPIDSVIRASRPVFESASTFIRDTTEPVELIEKLRDIKPLEHQVLLIVGSVGSGKSTFVDHLQYSALPRDIIDITVWVRVNMNDSPASSVEIFDWLRHEIIKGCRAAYPKIDFDDLEAIKAVFSVEVAKFDKGVGRLYKSAPDLYNIKLAEQLQALMSDLHKQTVAHTRYCATERAKLLVIVLDNCDKRTRDQQLLMFEAAQWLQKEFRALVVLPLREETYDNHYDQPPLDTALKDLVFRIEPPLFHNVLVKRIQLALNELNVQGEKTYRYELPNGFHVEFANSDKAFYLSSILHAIFSYDSQVRRMILGLSARNIRRSLEIFLDFCKSGHITEDHIFRIRQSQGQYLLPLPTVVRVLLRMNRRFYDSDRSYVKNLFAVDSKDERPNYFSRVMLLRWLRVKFPQQGPAGQKGYFPIRDAIKELTVYGIAPGVLLRDIEYLARAQAILTEDFKTEALGDEDLIRLGPAGFVHLDLLGMADYLAAVAEDTWFYDEIAARRVADRIRDVQKHYSPKTSVENAQELLSLLESVRERDYQLVNAIVAENAFEDLTSLSELREGVANYEHEQTAPKWRNVEQRYAIGREVAGLVVNVTNFGVFVELQPGITGLIPRSKLPYGFTKQDAFSVGETIVVRPFSINPLDRKMALEFVREIDALVE